MAISNSKNRITVSLDKDIVNQIKQVAKDENRTASQQINYILKNWLENNKQD